MTNPIDIRPEHLAIVKQILSDTLPPESKCWVFGSRAKWTAKDSSDLDLAIDAGKALTKQQSFTLSDAFEESDLPYKVDVVDLHNVSESFRTVIERDKVPLPDSAPLSAFVDQKRGITYGVVQPGQPDPSGVPIIRVNNIRHGRISTSDVMRISPEIEKKYQRTRLQGGEVLLTLVGTLGEVAIAGNELKDWNVARAVAVIPPAKNVSAKWLHICLSSAEAQHKMRSRATTTVQATLNLRDVAELPIYIPARKTQDYIEKVVSAIDEKMELNRRMNATLEAMARALFKSWFVDFDPVKAKMTVANHPPLEGGSKDGTSFGEGNEPPYPWEEIKRHYSQTALHHAKMLRKQQTDAEGLLWSYLRNKQLGGYKFRRQHPVGSYIVDFACLSHKLIVELDGSGHAETHQQQHDNVRDRFLREQGFTVLRFWNNEVFKNCFGVLEAIYDALMQTPPRKADRLSTLPQGEGDWSVEHARDYLSNMDADIAALFPDTLVDGMPSGWREDSIYSCAEFINGAAYKNMHFSDARDALPVIKIAELKGGIGQGTKYTNTNLGEKYLIDTGEILFSWSGSPETSIDTFLWVQGRAWLNQHIFRVIPKNRAERVFTFFLLKHLNPMFIEIAKDKQTTGLGHVTIADLKRLKATYPDKTVLEEFSAIASPWLNYIQKNLEENQTLSQLRDTLLPKLISGQLRVGDIGDSLKEAV